MTTLQPLLPCLTHQVNSQSCMRALKSVLEVLTSRRRTQCKSERGCWYHIQAAVTESPLAVSGLNLSLQHDKSAALTPLPDASGEWSMLHACFEEYA